MTTLIRWKVDQANGSGWLIHGLLRLSTRPPPPLKPDGSRARSFNRISRSTLMPNFAFNLNQSDECLAEKLVQEALLPAFRKLRPEKLGWNLSLVNIAVTNMSETAAESKDSVGRDIGRMLKRQDEVLQDWKVVDEQPVVEDDPPINTEMDTAPVQLHEGNGTFCRDGWEKDVWESDGLADNLTHACGICGSVIPLFAATAHDRYHSMAE